MATKPDEQRSRDAERVMIDIISSVPGFKPPSQARSRETTYAIVAAATELLRKRDYPSIRMQDIAEIAGCAVTAIYARFPDKYALLIAIHLLSLQEGRLFLDREIKVEKFRESGLPGLAETFIRLNDDYFKRNFNFIIAGIAHNDGEAYRITAGFMDAYALRIAKVAAVLMDVEVAELVPSAKFAIHTILGIYRDAIMASKHFPMPNVYALTQIFTFIIERRLTG